MKARQAKKAAVAVILVLSLTAVGNAQPVLNVLYNIGGAADSQYPQAGLITGGNRLYGAAVSDGNYGYGMIFAINPDGTGLTNLHNFTTLDLSNDTNTDGAYPISDLVLSGGSLYGTAWIGGTSGQGTIFKVSTNGMAFTNLFNFSGTNDGAQPLAGLVVGGNILYGTTSVGGSWGYGAVFAINTDGTDYTNLHSFSPLDSTRANTDGAHPRAQLILAGTALYGVAPTGGTSGGGTIFRININGTGFTNLYDFTALDPTTQTNVDGFQPYAGLVLAGNTLYGTAFQGGSSGYGTIFSIDTNGTGFAVLHTFSAANGDGAYPYGGLIISSNTLYGTTQEGGDTGYGIAFAINTDGMGFAVLHKFSSASYGSNTDGAWPMASLLLIDNTLYGTTSLGGSSSYGTVFALTLAPALTIAPAGNHTIISWPTWAPHFTLQVATNLSSVIWNDITNAPSTVGDNYVLTNTVSGKAAFFRLKGQ
jgi:uncharacterized repeat protein (TIGR03803 family)